jgi:hypothetical protein
MKPAAGGRERPGRSLHTQCVVETPDRCPSVILPRESGHRSSPRRARQRQHEHRTAMRHVVVHVAFGLRCARGGGRASALKAGVESRPLSPSDSVARRDVGRRPRARRGLREGGRRVGARSRECCRFHVRWFFPGDRLNSTNEATKRRAAVRNHASVARSRIWKARALSTIERTQTQGIRGHAGYSLNSLSAGSVRHESCQLIRHVRDHTLSPSLGASHVAKSCRMRRRCQRLTTSWLMTIPTPSE